MVALLIEKPHRYFEKKIFDDHCRDYNSLPDEPTARPHNTVLKLTSALEHTAT
jgi:hypothetical protein